MACDLLQHLHYDILAGLPPDIRQPIQNMNTALHELQKIQNQLTNSRNSVHNSTSRSMQERQALCQSESNKISYWRSVINGHTQMASRFSQYQSHPVRTKANILMSACNNLYQVMNSHQNACNALTRDKLQNSICLSPFW